MSLARSAGIYVKLKLCIYHTCFVIPNHFLLVSRLWGKIQILGLGASIKILLTSEEDISRNGLLSRQEVIALINTLNQLCKSVEFASDALSNNQSLESRIFPTLLSNARTIIIIFTCMLLIFIAYFRAYIFSKSKAD